MAFLWHEITVVGRIDSENKRSWVKLEYQRSESAVGAQMIIPVDMSLRHHLCFAVSYIQLLNSFCWSPFLKGSNSVFNPLTSPSCRNLCLATLSSSRYSSRGGACSLAAGLDGSTGGGSAERVALRPSLSSSGGLREGDLDVQRPCADFSRRLCGLRRVLVLGRARLCSLLCLGVIGVLFKAPCLLKGCVLLLGEETVAGLLGLSASILRFLCGFDHRL